MSQQQIKTEDIRSFFKTALARVGYSESRIERFCGTAGRLHEYMVACGISYYTPEIGCAFVMFERDSGEVGMQTLKTDRRAIEVINLIIEGKPMFFRRKEVSKTLPGEIGKAAEAFLQYCRTEERSCVRSIDRYVSVLSPFSIYCNMTGKTLSNIDYKGILGYMSSRTNVDSKTASVLRIFFRYLHYTGRLSRDFSLDIANVQPRRMEKVPSFYSREEVARMEAGVERTCPMGKRDYAVLLLASRLGLRASDIAGLEFSNFDWEDNVLRLRQEKTGRAIELPLLADVGNAVIDYVMHGRPNDDRKKVFLSCRMPYRPIHPTTVSGIVSNSIAKAGIDRNGRRHGAHCLRHSLAFNMLGSGSSIGTISSALGHSSSQSTMSYMGIDIGRLLECSLTVPLVNASFYNQSGGLLYE